MLQRTNDSRVEEQCEFEICVSVCGRLVLVQLVWGTVGPIKPARRDNNAAPTCEMFSDTGLKNRHRLNPVLMFWSCSNHRLDLGTRKAPLAARGRVTESKPSVGDGASIHHSLEVHAEDRPDLWIFEFSEQRQHFAEMYRVFNFTVLCRLLIS